MKSLDSFKPPCRRKDLNLAWTPNLAASILRSDRQSRVNHQAKGNLSMYDSIQLSKTASFRTTSQITWPNDNKAAGNCFHALIGGLRPASLILARRIAFQLVLLGAGLLLIQPCAGQSGTWMPTGSLATARTAFTATLLPNGKVLVAGGSNTDANLASAELYDPASGTWTATGSLGTARHFHTATLLPNGKVLVAGGSNTETNLASAELYDPASGTWTATGSLGTARRQLTATLLPDGKVLVAGGFASRGPSASVELYDPALGTWSTTGSLGTARDFHTATLLPDGKVLVAGGIASGGFPSASAELYDPASGIWTTTGSLGTTRYGHTATLLPNGNVLVAGGEQITGEVASAELYDPASGTWIATGSLAAARFVHTANLLPDGKVLVAGGFAGPSIGDLASAELYDPASGTWIATGSLGTAREDHTATLLPNGNVLVAGGTGNDVFLASAELYLVPATTPSQSLNISTRMEVLTDDQVLIGGFIITGNDPKKVVLRAIGPSLAGFYIANPLADPVLELHGADGSLIATNDNWKDTQQSEIEATGIQPQNDLESAIVRTLDPGSYTAIVSGKGGGTGVGLIEGYDLDQAADSQFANISNRGFVGTGSNVMIAGFILGGGAGNASVVVRALGPSLTQFEVSGALADPTLELHDANGALIRSNDNWKETQQTDIEATGLQPTNDLESAIFQTLAPGAYTAIVGGKGDLTGVGLVEVYRLP